MKSMLLRTALVGLFFGLVSVANCQDPDSETINRLRADLTYLADDDRQGRGVGTQGLLEAGAFIAERFSELGLNTTTFGGVPFQDFTVADGFELSAVENDQPSNWLKLSGPNGTVELELEKQWSPLLVGRNGEFEGELVFAGYGISSKEENYDDFANIDVKGKVVIVIRKEPMLGDSNFNIFGASSPSKHAYFSTKELNAAVRSAAALIVVNDFKSSGQSDDRVLQLSEGGKAFGPEQIPTVNVSRAAIEPLISQALGKSLIELERQIAESKQPASQILASYSARGKCSISTKMVGVRNVVGVLPGSGDLTNQYVVVGAHYDHVGLGGEGSLAPGTIAVHNGADDNGSGTVGLLEIARIFSQRKPAANQRTLVFIAFAAEERGLLGSEHYVRYPAFPLEQTVAMLNFDMIGRMSGGSLTVYGLGTATEFSDWLDRANQQGNIELNKENAGMGPSDHQSFFLRGIPVFHFFTGLHGQYHRPSDDVPLVDFEGISRIVLLASNLLDQLVTSDNRPTFVKNKEYAQVGPNAGRRKATLGVQLAADQPNCIVKAVAENSPAMTAGIMPGDEVTKIGQQPINSADELVKAMERFRPKQQIEVQLRRGQELISLQVVL